jgi:hypothetical protein
MPEVGQIYLCNFHNKPYVILSISPRHYQVKVAWLCKTPYAAKEEFVFTAMRRDTYVGMASELLLSIL